MWCGSAVARTFNPRAFFLNKFIHRSRNGSKQPVYRKEQEKTERARGNREDGEGDAQEVEGKDIQLEEVGWRWHRRRKASGTWAEEGGQLGAFSAS